MQTLTINNQAVEIKEYQGQRVITFNEVDKVHKKAAGMARAAFNRHKKHFICNVDYFVHDMHEAKKLYGITAPNGITLLTESGYLLLAKVFDDDLAWQVQRELVNNYFRKGNVDEPITKAPTAKYVYREKFYKGIPVLTIKDLAHFTKVPESTLSYALRNYKESFAKDVDFWLLTRGTLRQFKEENSLYGCMASTLYIISASGITKLSELLHQSLNVPSLRAPEKSLPFEIPHKVLDAPISTVDQISNNAVAIQEIMRRYRKLKDEKYRAPLRDAAWILAVNTTSAMHDLGSIFSR